MSTGRNDPCPCGSGKKYKKCHLSIDERSSAKQRQASSEERPVRPMVLEKLRQHQARERERIARFGDVRDIIAVDFAGQKVVAVGNEIYHSENWRTFADFLLAYIKSVLSRAFGVDWAPNQLKLPLAARHPILQWLDAFYALAAKASQGEDGLYTTTLDGPASAYLSLAYDLYVLKNNLALQADVVHRMKDKGHFQHARYELTVAATMIRAGFAIEYEDERDNRRRHPEFLATYRRTGERVAVEAKSRKRSGVLGYKGPRDTPDRFRLGIESLVRDALGKATEFPYLVFVDANMAPDVSLKTTGWLPEVNDMLVRVAHGFGDTGVFEGTPLTALLVTNFPHDYGLRGERDPGKVLFVSEPTHAKRKLSDPSVMASVTLAVRQYGHMPSDFPTP